MNFWQQLIKPSSQIVKQQDRTLAKFNSAILLTIIPLISIFLLIEEVNISRKIVILVFLSTILILYFISRTKHFKWSAKVFVYLTAIQPFLHAHFEISTAESFERLAISILFGSLWLSLPELSLMIFIELIGVSLFQIYHPEFLFSEMMQVHVFLAIISTFTIFVRVIRKQLINEMIDLQNQTETLVIERTRELQESITRWQSLLKTLPDLIFQLSRSGVYLEFHNENQGYLAKAWSEIKGKPIQEVHPPELSSTKMQHLKKTMETGEPHTIEYTLDDLRSDGHGDDWEARCIKIDENNALYMVRNITEKKQAERELKNSKQEVENALEKLRLTQAELIQASKLSALGEMATGIAHELNNPLGTIYLSIGSIKESLEETLATGQLNDEEDKQEILDSIDRIERNIKRCKDITSHVRRFGRDTYLERYEFIDFNKAVSNSLVLVHQQLKASNIQLIEEYSDIFLGLNGNILQLEQIIFNLINNAKDALIDTQDKKITLRTYVKDNRTVFEIEDNGEGISPEIIDKVMDPFFTTKSVGNGTGLGLAVSYRMIEEHEGHLTVESKLGKGTVFRFDLPFLEDMN